MKTVKELRQEIDKVMLPGYVYKTNLSWSECIIDINYKLWIGAKLVRRNNEMMYEFIVDTQFLSDKEISYEEICMCKGIIEILKRNRKFVLKRLKKYTVEDYEREKEENKKRQDAFIQFLDSFVHKKDSLVEYETYDFVEDKIDINGK